MMPKQVFRAGKRHKKKPGDHGIPRPWRAVVSVPRTAERLGASASAGADAADRMVVARAHGRELGEQFLRFFLLAVRAFGLGFLGAHGLEQHEILAAGPAGVLIERHASFPP